MIIHLSIDSFSTGDIHIQQGADCSICHAGYGPIPIISIDENITDSFVLSMTMENNQLISYYKSFPFDVIGCPVGKGPDINNFTCTPCGNEYYNLASNNLDECKSCNMDTNSGIQCYDGNIIISYNYWVKVNDNGAIISSNCPPQTCCPEANGCIYTESDELCAKGRDQTSSLCGKCIDGYSESLNGQKCVDCKEKSYYVYLLLPLGFALLTSVFLTAINTESTRKKKTGKEFSNKISISLGSDHYRLMISIMMFKCILYYQQAIAQTLLSK